MAADLTAEIKAAFPGRIFGNGDIANMNGVDYKFDGNTKQFAQTNDATGTGDGASASENRKETVAKWDEEQDARKLPGAGKYPNYWAQKTRSGHVIMLDDSKGAESVTIQHRTGSMIQIKPDGKVHVRAQKGQHTVVFGENRMYVTGAYDITVDGATSITSTGDFNINSKNVKVTAREDMTFNAKNINMIPTKGLDIAAESMTAKIKGSAQITSTDGAVSVFGETGFSAGSHAGETVLVSSKDMGFESKGGRIIAQSAAKMSLKSGSAMSIRADGGKMSMSATGIVAIDSDTEGPQLQKGLSEPPEQQKSITMTPAKV
jgi:hypothetical protein